MPDYIDVDGVQNDRHARAHPGLLPTCPIRCRWSRIWWSSIIRADRLFAPTHSQKSPPERRGFLCCARPGTLAGLIRRRHHQRHDGAGRRQPSQRDSRLDFPLPLKMKPAIGAADTSGNGGHIGRHQKGSTMDAFRAAAEQKAGNADQQRRQRKIRQTPRRPAEPWSRRPTRSATLRRSRAPRRPCPSAPAAIRPPGTSRG